MTAAKPKQKLYESTSAGGINVKSGRKIGEVRIPNYVYDLWLPLIGGDALAVYGVYCRLERQKVVKAITLKDIAKACRIGDRKLRDINDLLMRYEFIVIKKPEGQARANHFTTEITTLNPPLEVPPQIVADYKLKGGYTPLSAWLVDEDAPNSASAEKPFDASAEKPYDYSKREVKQLLQEKSYDVPILLQPLYLQSSDVATSSTKQPQPLEAQEKDMQPSGSAIADSHNLEISDRQSVLVSSPSPISAPPPSHDAEPTYARVFTIYVDNMRQQVTPLIKDALLDAVKQYGEGWVEDAIKEAVMNNAPKWVYAAAILERWGKDGKGTPRASTVRGAGVSANGNRVTVNAPPSTSAGAPTIRGKQ